ncbi:MAG: hypothetical protein DRN37_11640 [Thermoplasmata archaeon]|nr:MAG: hypothetical protein DRN37_11640 [Thermoplasmata archaeon]
MEKESQNQGPESSTPNAASKKYLFDDPRNVKILLRSFFSSLLVLLLIEFLVSKHPHFPWESWPEFYAVFGFVACVALVLAAKYILRPLVKRREDYYD